MTNERTETHACDSISRRAALDCVSNSLVAWEAYEAIEALPAAEPGRKTGRWIHKGGGSFICSDCGEMVGLNVYRSERACEIFRYCPHCGAYMGGEEDGSD